MDILTALEQKETWLAFMAYRNDGHRLTPQELQQLQGFIDAAQYLPILARIRSGEPFPHPRRAEISKHSSEKKRVVYVYPPQEALVLKAMTHLLLRRYDHLFSPSLYSFRSGHGAKEAIGYLTSRHNIDQQWCYKADIRNYFNSIPVQQLLPQLEEILGDEPALFSFLSNLLLDPQVYHNGQLVSEEKGIMAGTPISTFLANVYLMSLDQQFFENRWLYARYSDDIILFAPSLQVLEERKAHVIQFLSEKGLQLNPEKESVTAPGGQWTFLGIAYRQGCIDICPASVDKIKGKMRRKSRALMRWADKNQVSSLHAVKAFIRIFNRKLFENPRSSDLTWARWFFPIINTDQSLRQIDHYAQQCIRYIATGTHTKSSYNFRYGQMKDLGYCTLVNRYYADKNSDILE